jgi:anaerobic selenocysteine-containing dehydrogenase
MREVADRLWGDKPAVVYGRVGACVQAFGGLSMWAINLLNILSGNFDREGGWMYAQPAFDLVSSPMGFGVGPGSFGRWRSRVRDLPEFGGELPVVTMAEEILTEGEGQVRGLLTVAGNPVLSSPNGRQVEDALQSLEFYAAVDMYLNETTRHAHIILPPTSQLERSHYDLVFNLLAVRETAKWSGPAIEKSPNARHDWEILQGLTRRILNLRGTKLGPKARELALEKLGPDRVLDLGLRMGPHGTGPNPFGKGLSLNRLAATPHGVDLGPLRSCMPGRLPAHRSKIALAPQVYLDDLPRLRQDLTATRLQSALELVSRRQLRSNNSWMHNAASLMKGPRRCTLLMHPRDLEARGIQSGSRVALRSRVGEVQLEVEADEDMMPGVVCMPHGFGHGREGTRMRVANEADHAGVSVNDVTDDGFFDALSGNAGFSGVSVLVEAILPDEAATTGA